MTGAAFDRGLIDEPLQGGSRSTYGGSKGVAALQATYG